MILKKNLSKLIITSIASGALIGISCNNDDSAIMEEVAAAVIDETTLFTAEVDTTDSLTVNFRHFSADAVTFLWEFGDATSSTSEESDPSYTYAESGTYTVKLTTFDAGGNIIDWDEIMITVEGTASVEVEEGEEDAEEPVEEPVVVEDPIVVTVEPASGQFAFITDTSDADTGELRLTLDESIAKGMMSVTINKEMTQDGFINLSGTSTSRANAMIDLKINDSNGYSFTDSGENVNANFPAFVNDEFVDIVITWDATVDGEPLVTFSINGEPITADAFPSPSEDPASVADGVKTIQFRVGENSAFDTSGLGMLLDNLTVYDTSTETPSIVFGDDFEGYTVGSSLNPDDSANSPYNTSSFQATVSAEGFVAVVDEETTDASNNQIALVTDTFNGDTGELKLDLGTQIEVGMITVLVSKNISDQRGFVNLSGVGSNNTSRVNAMIDLQIGDGSDYSFTEFGVNATITNPVEVVNDDFVEVMMTWDASGSGSPMVEIFVDGQSLTGAPFATNAGLSTDSDDLEDNNPDAVADGVGVVQFRFGGGTALDATGAGLSIDDLRVYDTSSGNSELVFADDFESYTVGNSLDPNDDSGATIVSDTPYSDSTFQATVSFE